MQMFSYLEIIKIFCFLKFNKNSYLDLEFIVQKIAKKAYNIQKNNYFCQYN